MLPATKPKAKPKQLKVHGEHARIASFGPENQFVLRKARLNYSNYQPYSYAHTIAHLLYPEHFPEQLATRVALKEVDGKLVRTADKNATISKRVIAIIVAALGITTVVSVIIYLIVKNTNKVNSSKTCLKGQKYNPSF